MKQVLLIISFFALGLTLSAQTIVGGAGVCSVDDDPDNITDMQTQDERYDCLIAFDHSSQMLYYYDETQLAGARWIAIAISAANVADILAGTGISVTNVGGDYTITNALPEATTTTDGNTIDFTKTGDDITAEVIIDGTGSVTLSSSGAGLKAEFTETAQTLSTTTGSNAITTLSDGGGTFQITGGDGITANAASGNYTLTNDNAVQGAYKNHSDAAGSGVALDEVFEVVQANTMGLPAGTLLRRSY